MRIVLQRVSSASVRVLSQRTASCPDALPLPEPQGIGLGLLVLVAVSDADDDDTVSWMSRKIAHLRIFEDDAGAMNRSIREVQGEILSISQFTLYGDARKGNRPSFMAAGKPEHAEHIWNQFNEALRSQGIIVRTGTFATHMSVKLVNDGPVTLILER
ncbi:D-aminoacyl-tRNA deacylase [Bifidobacterium aquikefiricola]|uniref:D-aminoacyl-tRNA deacylase n=1 Tax=Bifidobacterium aquikefiricola TaxID=3059038 RepID=A0AB39U8L3_9BIFI